MLLLLLLLLMHKFVYDYKGSACTARNQSAITPQKELIVFYDSF